MGFLIVTAFAANNYIGSLFVLMVFNVSSLVLFALAFVGRFSYTYFFLSLFLLLGFWLKFTIHTIFVYPYLEPVGNFDFSPASWDKVLLSVTAIFLGLIAYRLLSVAMDINSKKRIHGIRLKAPSWYVENRTAVWVIYWLIAFIVFFLNYLHGYYKTGIHSVVELPPVLSVLAPFIVFIGLAFVLSAFLGLEAVHYGRITKVVAMAVMLEGMLASFSMVSRAAIVMHVLPFLVALIVTERKYGVVLMKNKVSLVGVFVMTLGVVLVIVSYVRISSYPDPVAALSDQVLLMVWQNAFLFTDRWVGIEGVMAVTSFREVGSDLFLQGVLEDPNSGVNSIYQYISNSFYKELEGFTFLTLPGFGAVLLYSGSKVIVFITTFIIGALAHFVEHIARKASRNPFLVSLASAAVANSLCQMNFPYLFLTFMVLMVSFFAVLRYLRPVYLRLNDSSVF
jgi:hypothetical protein